MRTSLHATDAKSADGVELEFQQAPHAARRRARRVQAALVRRLARPTRDHGRFLAVGDPGRFERVRDTVDCCIIKGASCPRAAKAYDDDAYVSLETLRAEIQAKDDVNVYKLSGHALKHGVRERWGHANPGYMQIDDGIIVDDDGFVTHVRGEPIDEERIYRVASFKSLERESDGEIIAGELKAHPERMPGEDDGVQCHALLVGHWARRLWERIYALADADGDGRLSAEEFATLDLDGSGRINRKELKHAIARAGYETFSGEYTLVEAVLEAAGDLDGDGKLSRWEINAHAKEVDGGIGTGAIGKLSANIGDQCRQ